MKKILLDTTYLLPAVGISVEGLPDDLLLSLVRNSEYRVYINNISLFEIIAKASKYIVKGLIRLARVIRGLKAITHSDDLIKIDYVNDAELIAMSFHVRKHVNDYIDALILASAIRYIDIFLTEDPDLLEIQDKEWFKELTLKYNPSLSIINYRRFKEAGPLEITKRPRLNRF